SSRFRGHRSARTSPARSNSSWRLYPDSADPRSRLTVDVKLPIVHLICSLVLLLSGFPAVVGPSVPPGVCPPAGLAGAVGTLVAKPPVAPRRAVTRFETRSPLYGL